MDIGIILLVILILMVGGLLGFLFKINNDIKTLSIKQKELFNLSRSGFKNLENESKIIKNLSKDMNSKVDDFVKIEELD